MWWQAGAWPPRRAHCATNFIKHAKSIARMATEVVEEENIAADYERNMISLVLGLARHRSTLDRQAGRHMSDKERL